MRLGKLLTQEQYDLVVNQKFNNTNYFLPLKDTFDNWVIEMAQVEQITNPNFSWINDCPEIEFDYPTIPLPQLLNYVGS
jgi:hypothetical protein